MSKIWVRIGGGGSLASKMKFSFIFWDDRYQKKFENFLRETKGTEQSGDALVISNLGGTRWD